MSQYEMRYHPETKTVWLKGDFDPMPDNTYFYGYAQLPDPVYPGSVVAYHAVRDALYGMSDSQVNVPGHWPNVITDMASITIKWASELPPPPFEWSMNLSPSITIAETGTDMLGLFVLVGGGRAPYTYRWYKNDVLITGLDPTNNEFIKANPVVADSGSYKVEVIEADGTVHLSNVCAVTVNP